MSQVSAIRRLWERTFDEIERRFLAKELSAEEAKSELRGLLYHEELVDILFGVLYDMRKHGTPYGGSR